MIIKRISPITNQLNSVDVNLTSEQYSFIVNWGMSFGEMVVAFPELSIDEAEFLTSGISPQEWKTYFEDAVNELEESIHGRECSYEEAYRSLGDPSTWKKHSDDVYDEFRKKPDEK